MSKKWAVALFVGFSLMCSVGLVGLMFLVKHAADKRKARDPDMQFRVDDDTRILEEERQQARNEARPVFGAPTKNEREEFTHFFAAFDRALKNGEQETTKRAFDTERWARELDQTDAFKLLTPSNAALQFRDIRTGLSWSPDMVLHSNLWMFWFRTEINCVRWSADGEEAIVSATHFLEEENDGVWHFRWWFARRGGKWLIYDFEDVDNGLRATHITVAILATIFDDEVAVDSMSAYKQLDCIHRAIICSASRDRRGAEAQLEKVRAIHRSRPLQAIMELAEGTVLLTRDDAESALTRFEKTDQLLPNIPLTALSRARAYTKLGRHEDALAAIRAYQKEVGPDALSCTIEGQSLAAQGKKPEAADAYRRALDDVAESPDAFDGLRRMLPNNQKGELGERLARLKEPRKFYDRVIYRALNDNDDAGSDALLDALLKIAPDDTRALSDDIRRNVKRKKFDDAAKILLLGLNAKKDADSILSAYLFAMLDADKALEGYAVVPRADADTAFRRLADVLDEDILDDNNELARVNLLQKLIEEHRKRSPEDAWLWYYDGSLLQHAKEYEKAEKTFAEGAAKLKPKPVSPDKLSEHDWAIDSFRNRRVDCLFKLKKGLDAYRDIGPPNDTFHQLAGLYDAEKDFDGLTALLKLHTDSGVNDPERVFWQAHLLYHRSEYGRAVAVYYKYLEKTNEESPNAWRARNELLRSRVRINPKGAAETLAELGPDKVSNPLRAAIAAANDDRKELERLLEESVRFGGKTWFYSDEDFRRFINQEKYHDLRAKYPEPDPSPKRGG